MKRAALKLLGRQKGFTLIEVLVAIAVLGIIAVMFLSATALSSRAVIIANQRATIEGLARSQMEYVKGLQAYAQAPSGGVSNYARISGIPSGYSIWSKGRGGVEVDGIVGVPWNSDTSQEVTNDQGLQLITIIIKYGGQNVWLLADYKVNR